jgi:2-polyprenyl-3-methyl-5-hydroxy-6-metoxy-1,4-benzoquinol methylase
MSKNPLAVIATDDKIKRSTKATKRERAKAILDELWQLNPDQFNPLSDCMGRERYKRTCNLIDAFCKKSNNLFAADLGTGSAIFTFHLVKNNMNVDAVDLATTPIQNLEKKQDTHIKVFQDYIPHTTLDSDAYDLVLGLDVIAYLQKPEHRLFVAELARLIKLEGFVVGSTPIDIHSEDALQQFADLAESEFKIEKWILSYHRYFIQLLHFFEAPFIFVKASQNPELYEKELNKRFSINRNLFKFNTSKTLSYLWSFIGIFTTPIHKLLKQNSFIMFQLEKLCRFISVEKGISHAIFIGKRRKFFENVEADKAPIERKSKQQVWE